MPETPTLRATIARILPALLAVSLLADTGLGEVARQMHPWGRFEPGAWKLVRIVTDTFDENGAISSVTETKTTLSEVGPTDVTLLVEVSVEVAGKQFDAEPQEVHQAFNGEPVDDKAKVTDQGTAELDIQGRKIPCRIQQLEVEGPAGKATTQIYYSETVAPYILKRQSKTTDADGKVQSETTVDVIALDVPTNVFRNGIRPAAHLKAMHKNAKGTTTTLAVVCMDVPGGVVCHSLKELDESGRMVRRSLLEIVDYGLTPDDQDQGGFFHRRRTRSTRKTYRYYVPR
jgi:hypothetical protein